MDNKSVEKTLADIGGRMSKIGEPGSDTYFLYIETQDGVQSPRLMQEFSARVQDVDPSVLYTLLYDLWLDAYPQWGALIFDLKGERFSAKFDYDVDPTDGNTDERSLAAVKARFPDKPVIYLSNDEYRKQRIRHRALFEG